MDDLNFKPCPCGYQVSCSRLFLRVGAGLTVICVSFHESFDIAF